MFVSLCETMIWPKTFNGQIQKGPEAAIFLIEGFHMWCKTMAYYIGWKW